MIRAPVLEDQIASYVGGMRLPPDYLGLVVEELRRRRQLAALPEEIHAIERELERWRRLFTLGEIDEGRLRRETVPLKRALAVADRPTEVLDVEEAVRKLRDIGSLWMESPRDQQRAFVRELFQRIVVSGPEVVSITPKAAYAPLFVLDRRERFGQPETAMCSLAPRRGLGPPNLHNASESGHLLTVPALVLPEAVCSW